MSVFGDAELFDEFENAGEVDNESSDNEENSNDSFEDEYREKYKSLKIENESLKRSLKILERPGHIKIKDAAFDGPIAHVLLFNNLITRKYREEIKDFFFGLANRRLGDEDIAVTDPQPTYIQFSSPKTEKRHKKSSKREATKKAFQAFSSIQVYTKFFIDQLGEPLSFQDPTYSDWYLPGYEQSNFEPMTGDPNEGMQKKKKKIQRICFNCGGTDHQIKDCEKSRDHQAISERRQKFLDEVAKCSDGSPQIRLDGPRYHADDGEDNKERFASFRPGVISTSLQEALGITEDDIPPYIYQMRNIGYPPGHLHSARITQSGLLLYENSQTDGKEQENEYAPINVEKIIGYPGFNIPPLPGQEDKFHENYVPAMNNAQSKEVMISYFEHRNNLYNQRKAAEDRESELRKENERKDEGIDAEEIDMEMEDDEEVPACDNGKHEKKTEVKMDDRPPEPLTYELEDGEVDDIEGIEVGDLTEDELEIKRELLLKELTRQQADNKNDSDYRNIKSNDQDYRIRNASVVDLTGDTSESDVVIQETVMQDVSQISAEETEIVLIDTSAEFENDERMGIVKERNISSDTDYRMMPAIPKIESPIISNVCSTESDSENIPHLDSETSQEMTEESGVPNREKFAKGITQFDAYYQESKSRGVYKKLRNLLKDSPRRQEK